MLLLPTSKKPIVALFAIIAITWSVHLSLYLIPYVGAQGDAEAKVSRDSVTIDTHVPPIVSDTPHVDPVVASSVVPRIPTTPPVKVPPVKKVQPPLPAPATKKQAVQCRSDLAQEWVQYAYDIGGIDFVGTIAAESKFDPHALGDYDDYKRKINPRSYGYCQFHSTHQKENQAHYRTLKTNKERLDFCFEKYSIWVKKGIIHKRLYGYNVRNTKGLPKLNIVCE